MVSIAEAAARDGRERAAGASTTLSPRATGAADRGHRMPTSDSIVPPLDPYSRRVVRTALTRMFMDAPEPDAWKLAPIMDRGALVARCARAVRDHMATHPDHARAASWSVRAVAREVDFYLPKVVLHCMRSERSVGIRARRSPREAYVDVDSEPFKGWVYLFPETRARLDAEFEAARRREPARTREGGRA